MKPRPNTPTTNPLPVQEDGLLFYGVQIPRIVAQFFVTGKRTSAPMKDQIELLILFLATERCRVSRIEIRLIIDQLLDKARDILRKIEGGGE